MRRKPIEVAKAQLLELERLEKEQAMYEEIRDKNLDKPIHFAAIKIIAQIVAAIAVIVKAVRARRKHK